MKRLILFLAVASAVATAQGFKASGVGSDSYIWTHTVCQGTGCAVNNRLSTSNTTGATTTAYVTAEHYQGKDYAVNAATAFPALAFMQFGTGTFLSGDLSSVAVFDSDQSYVTFAGVPECGQIKLDGTCKLLSPSGPLFTGIFVGRMTWETNADTSHTIKGTVKGFVTGNATAQFLSFTATTESVAGIFTPGTTLFLNRDGVKIATFDVEPF